MEEGLSMMDKNLTKIQADLQALTGQIAVGPKVGFSAALASGTVGPGEPQTIVFKHVFINNGNAYDPTTGYFTAPQKGAYLFTFTAQGGPSASYWSGAKLVKNGEDQVTHFKSKVDGYDGTSGAVILSLNARDRVNVMTVASNYQVIDDSGRYTTFSGFLLFPL